MTVQLASDFRVTEEQVRQFRTNGFVKLKGFFGEDVLDSIRARVEYELRNSFDDFKGDLSNFKYDFESDKDLIYSVIGQKYFAETLSALTARKMFLTFEMCFEVEKNVSAGIPWHVGVHSFGYQRAEDFGCTVWAPLEAIDTKGQKGGMRYVPRTVMSGEFMYQYVEPAMARSVEIRAARGEDVSISDYFALRMGVLNSPAMVDIMETHAVEDDFELGDVFVFDKYVVHRSVRLGEGPVNRRAAFVMRFVDSNSRYDLPRALDIDLPVRQFNHALATRSHMEVATEDGELFAEGDYFDRKEARTVFDAEAAARFPR